MSVVKLPVKVVDRLMDDKSTDTTRPPVQLTPSQPVIHKGAACEASEKV